VRLAGEAKVKQFIIFHHDPDHDDAFMDRIAAAAEKLRPGTLVAKEGLTLSL
jgi:phosphoribosyl 1,2-cyclic phosphodiesterase